MRWRQLAAGFWSLLRAAIAKRRPWNQCLRVMERRPLLVSQILERAVRNHGRRLAIVDGATRLTYDQLANRVDRLARGMRVLGVRPGESVAIFMPNCAEWVIAFFAAAKLGAVPVGINTRCKPPEIEHLLSDSGAVLLVMERRIARAGLDLAGMTAGLLALEGGERPPGLHGLRHVVVNGAPTPRNALAFAEVEQRGSTEAELPSCPRGPDDVALIVYTSGTTGRPKGCMLSHRALHEAGLRRTTMMPWGPEDVNLVTTPFAHIGGTNGAILATCFVGATQVLTPTFDAGETLDLMERERVTTFYGVPAMYLAMLDHPTFRSRNLSSLRKGSIGSAPVPIDLMRRILDPGGGLGIDVLVGYGQSEAGGVSHHTRLGDSPERRVSTVGLPAAGIEDRIVDPDTGRDCTTGGEGEVWVKTSQMMLGYYRNPEATAARMVDGWLRTGDIGVKDADGYLRITGRMADTIIVGGFNAYPVEIENCLIQHPDVREVSVIGVPDRRLGEVVLAFVVPRPGRRATAESIISFARPLLANYKVPRHVAIVDGFPVNEAGKVEKRRQKMWALENITELLEEHGQGGRAVT